MKTKLNVKDKSVYKFLQDRLVNPDKENKDQNYNQGQINASAYHLMRDELIFKKDCGIELNEVIEIELVDTSRGSGKELINTYYYKASEYDDVSIMMKLIDFKVKLN